jgi:hypothetical protein
MKLIQTYRRQLIKMKVWAEIKRAVAALCEGKRMKVRGKKDGMFV